MTGSSTWATGTADSATTLHNGVDEKRAEHINGPASAIVAIESKLGSAASLVGTKSDLATRLAVGILSSGRLTSAEAGDLCMSARSTKAGWSLCDGGELSRSTESELFAEIGTTFGAGNGTTTFNKPNYCGRIPIGTGTGAGGGATGTGEVSGGDALPNITLGAWQGENTHLLTDDESGLPEHAHNIDTAAGSGGGAVIAGTSGATGNTGSTATQGGDNAAQAHNNMPPVLGINIFIKL